MSRLYFVTGLRDEQLDRLDDAFIWYRTESRKLPQSKQSWVPSFKQQQPINGVLLDEENFQNLLDVLGASPVEQSDLGEAVYHPRLEFTRTPKPVVVFHSWPESAQDAKPDFAQILEEELLRHTGSDIVVHAAGTPAPRAVDEDKDDGLLHLYIWSTPRCDNQPAPVACETLWDCPLADPKVAYHPSPGDHSVLLYDIDEIPVGQLEGKNRIYAFFDLIGSGTANEQELFRRFCREVHLYRNLDTEKRGEVVLEWQKKDEQQRLAQYKELCTKRLEAEIVAARKMLAEAEARLQKVQAEYRAALHSAEQAEAMLLLREKDHGGALDEIEAEFRRFEEDKKILRIRPFDGGLRVYTRTLYFRHIDYAPVRELGEMRIDLLLDEKSRCEPLRILNLTQQRDGSGISNPHPHVSSTGTPCWGGSKMDFQRLITARELYAAASYAIQFLETANDASYTSVSNWREVSEDKLLQLRSKGLLPAGA